MNKLVLRSFINALGVAVYASIVATLMQNGDKIFGKMNQATAPIAFLMLFVLSAGVTGGLVVGKPLLLYFDNKKTEAIKLFLYTLGWLALGTVILVLVSLVF